MRTLPIVVLLAASVFTSATNARAAASRPAHLGLCAACHGETGIARMPGAPNLAGQRLDYLRAALAQYRDGRRDVAVMRAAIGPISATDLDALARWYSAQRPIGQAPATQGKP